MLPVMVGCTHNKCKFCGLYRHLKFRVLPFDLVKNEIDQVVKKGGNPERVFLGDGNAFSLKANQLLEICNYIKSSFSACNEINMDATVTSILQKTDEDLQNLYDAGVRHLYLGIESGLDDVLEFMDKDHNQAQAAEAITRIKKVGMIFDAHIMSGVAGEGRGTENALSLADFFNKHQPQNICNFDMFLHKHTPLWEDYEAGLFRPEDAVERLTEVKMLVENIKPAPGTSVKYDAIFEAPPARFIGSLPDDTEKLINQAIKAIEKYSKENRIYSIWD